MRPGILFLLLLLAFSARAAEVGPVAPWGSSAVFQQTLLEAQTRMSEGKFDEAKRLWQRMPRKSLTVGLDVAKLPKERQADADAALRAAIGEWEEGVPGLKITLAAKPDVWITFVPDIPASGEVPIPRGAAFFESNSAKDPRVEAVVALARMAEKTPASKRDLRNEMVFAIGRFLGLEETPNLGGAMDRTNEMYRMDARVTPNNARLLYQVLGVVEQMGKLIERKVKIEPAKPEIFVDTESLSRKDGVVQGDVVAFSVGITNRGNAPLQVMVVPDCSCFAVLANPVVAPGETVRVSAKMDTREFPGLQHKRLTIFSNDLAQTVKLIPVEVMVQPRYRIVPAVVETVTIATDEGWTKELYFWTPEGSPLKPTKVTLDGAKGTVEFAAWKGSMADPALEEKAMPRTGYVIRVKGSPELVNGRVYANVIIETEDENWPRLAYSFALQKGIAVFPFTANFGRLTAGSPGVASVVLSRPGKPFKVLKVECSLPSLSATVEAARPNGDIPITVRFDGKASAGYLDANLTVTTDDAKQPTLVIPITAIIQ